MTRLSSFCKWSERAERPVVPSTLINHSWPRRHPLLSTVVLPTRLSLDRGPQHRLDSQYSMSRRSVASSTYSHERRKSKHRVADEDLFKCVSQLLHECTSCSRLSRAASFSESRKILSIPWVDCPDGNKPQVPELPRPP